MSSIFQIIWSEGSFGIISKSMLGGRLLVPSFRTVVDVVSCPSVTLDVLTPCGPSRLLIIESNCCHSWSSLGSIWVSTLIFSLPLSCSFFCFFSCSFSCSIFFPLSRIFPTARGLSMICCSGSLDYVVGVVANKSRGRVCNLYSLSLLNYTSLSSLYLILASICTWNNDSTEENKSSKSSFSWSNLVSLACSSTV